LETKTKQLAYYLDRYYYLGKLNYSNRFKNEEKKITYISSSIENYYKLSIVIIIKTALK